MGGRKREDLLGQVFGKLRVVADATPAREPGKRRPDSRWRCECACGNSRVVSLRALKTGTTTCGCGVGGDLIGRTFGRLTVLRRIPSRKSMWSTRSRWECRCACGKIHHADGMGLRNGTVKSCGCLRRETYLKHLESMRSARRRGMQAQRGRRVKRTEDAFDEVFGAEPERDPSLEPPKTWTGADDAAADLARALGMR